jgi:uncharacterized damage-inducible protein DinB
MHGEELLAHGVAAVKIAKCAGAFSRPVFLEIDKQFKAGKKTKTYLSGFKSIDALCKHIGISRKHFYNVINDNRSGRKTLSPAEQAAKDAAKEEALIKREEAKADREAKRRAEKERLKREAEELRAVRENNKKMQLSLDKKDEAVAQAKQDAADEVISKVTTAVAQKLSEKRPDKFAPEPKTDRDLYYFTIGAGSVKGVSLGSPTSIVKIMLQVLDGQIDGRQDAGFILRSLNLGIEDRLSKVMPPTPEPTNPEPQPTAEGPKDERTRLRAEYDSRPEQVETVQA